MRLLLLILIEMINIFNMVTRPHSALSSPLILVLLSMIKSSSAEIIKPMGEWLCNYCAMVSDFSKESSS